MKKVGVSWITVTVLLVAALSPIHAPAMERDERVVKTGQHTGDLFARGDDVTVLAQIEGKLIAMGGDIKVRAEVTEDVIVLGGELELGEEIGGDVLAAAGYVETSGRIAGDATVLGGRVIVVADVAGDSLVAGGSVDTDGRVSGKLRIIGGKIDSGAVVEGDLLAAGGKVVLLEGSTVHGNAWVAGGSARVSGTVSGELRVAARRVEIAGEVLGRVLIDAVEVEILPTAVIRGDFLYRSAAEADIHPEAQVLGDIMFERSETPHRVVGWWFATAGLAGLAVFGGLILLGAVLLSVFPNVSLSAARTIGGRPWPALGLGFAVLVACPVLILILMATVIGIPLAIFLIALYVAAVFSALLVAALAIGLRGARLFRRAGDGALWKRLLVLAGGLLALGLLILIPFFGVLVLLAALAFGLGALLLQSRAAVGASS